jgi:hypothetical protein
LRWINEAPEVLMQGYRVAGFAKRYGCGAGLVAILVFNVWLRGHAFGPAIRDWTGVDLYLTTSLESEPLSCDEAIYGYIGKQIAHGAVMYRDLTENKPPLGYWLYALAVGLVGASELTIRVLPIPYVLATAVLVWWTGLRLQGLTAALVAAFTFALASTDPYLAGEGANMEHMINFFAFGSLACLLVWWDTRRRGWLVAAGASLGAACLIKQIAGLHGAVYACALLLPGRRGTPAAGPAVRLRSRWIDVAALVAGLVMVIGTAVAVIVAQGAGDAAYDDIVRYARALVVDTPDPPHAPPWFVRWVAGNADVAGALPWPFGRSKSMVWWGTDTWPLWLSAIPGVLWLALGPKTSPQRRLAACWTLSAWAQVALPRMFWQHYYLLVLPGLAVAVAVTLGDLALLARSGRAYRFLFALLAMLMAAALAGTVWMETIHYVCVGPADLLKQGDPGWVDDRGLGRELGHRAAHLRRATLFVWGWQSPLYFYSGLDCVTPQVYGDPFILYYSKGDHPQARRRLTRTMQDLKKHRPAVIFVGVQAFPALIRLLAERYVPSRLATGLFIERDCYQEFEAQATP